jgi:hypothetical protein
VKTKKETPKIVDEKKKKEPFVVRKIEIKEIPDESGEVNESTIIKISFDGILIHLSVPAAMRLQRHLSEVLDN